MLNYTFPYIDITVIQIITAIIIAVVGFLVIKIIEDIMKRTFAKLSIPGLVSGLMIKILKMLLSIAVVLAIAAALGFNISALVLSISAIIGLILGFGLQDTWSNLAAGIWLAVIRPFRQGDYIEVAGYTGIVRGIGIMATELATFDNVYIMIPNKYVWGSSIKNYTRFDKRRIEITVGVAYGTNLSKAIEVAMKILKEHPLVLDEPAPAVAVTELADSCVKLAIRAWTETKNYGKVKADIIRQVYERFRSEGIEIPYPQLDIHIRDMPR